MTSFFRLIRQSVTLFFLAVLCFCAGSAIARVSPAAPPQIVPVSAGNEGNWGLSFQQEGKPPVANASADYLKQFHAYYAAQTAEKVLYLTFDAGYENGNTPAILDALKKHQAPAAFFLVGNYLETSPDLVKRMVEEGHTVGNHTYHHPDMSKISTKETFSKEQIIRSNRYRRYRDFLSGNLNDENLYTIEQVNQIIGKYYGKGKSEK